MPAASRGAADPSAAHGEPVIPASLPADDERPARGPGKREPTIALVGTPNCGKTTLFNALTGLRQKVANYPGVTVEKKRGWLTQSSPEIALLDLPGIYSFNAQTPDEAITREILLGESRHTARPAAILLILDGSALERSLALASGALALGLPTAAVVTMFDEIKARGGSLDVALLARELGVPVHPIVGHKGIGLAELRDEIAAWSRWPAPQAPADLNGSASRYAWARELLGRILRSPLQEDALSRRIDRVILHSALGPLIFLAVMALFFQSIFTWARPAMDAMNAACLAAGQWLGQAVPDGVLRGLIVNGLFRGVGSVVAFLPQILILFFLLFLLEDVGYMPRAAFLMDRLMGWAGLQGRSFIALISSYACAVPGIMATRGIPSPQDRLATILVAPWMTCSARLPVYALLIGTFVPDRPVLGLLRLQGLTLMALYLLGAVSSFAAAWLLRSSILRGQLSPFYMELPPYRLPSWRNVLLAMADRARIFLRRAGTVILGVSLAVWALLSFPQVPPDPGAPPAVVVSRQLSHSWAGRIGKALEPVFSPLGFDWRINVGILSSLPAREVMVATLAQIYAVEAGGDGAALRRALRGGDGPNGARGAMSLPTALSLLAFFVYALQCFSTLAVMRRETNGWTWPALAFCAMFACAWVASFVTYRVALALNL